MFDQQAFEHLGVRRQPVLALDIAIVERQGDIAQIDLGHRSTGGTRAGSGDLDQLLVERAAAQAPCKGDDPDVGHRLSSNRVEALLNWRIAASVIESASIRKGES